MTRKVPTIRQILRRSRDMARGASDKEILQLLSDIKLAGQVTDRPDQDSLLNTWFYWEAEGKKRGLRTDRIYSQLPSFNRKLGLPRADEIITQHYALLKENWTQLSRGVLIEKGRKIQQLAMKSAQIVFAAGARNELGAVIDYWNVIFVVDGREPEGRLPESLEEVEISEEVEA